MSNPDEFAGLTDDAILRTCRWFDGQHGRVGPGVLVAELRRGGRPQAQRRDLMAEQQQYVDSVVAWLRKHFPELDRPGLGPHPAAIAAVFRLHYRHGKGALTKASHGAAIRGEVERWEASRAEYEAEGQPA